MAAETIKGVKIKFGVDNKTANAELKKTQSSIKSLGKSALGIGAAFVGFRAITGILKSSTEAFIEQERVIAQLDASLKSTGNQIGYTSEELQSMAAGLQKVTTFGDEAIISAQSMLLTFTKIGKDVFPEVIKRSLDLSAKMGQDLKSSVVQLGKALNDPVANLGALSRTGIQFTKDQKVMIKTLWEAGKATEAQAIILKELNTQFGGSAQAEAATYGGQLKQLSNDFGDMGEIIGSRLVPGLVEMGKVAKEVLGVMIDLMTESTKVLDVELRKVKQVDTIITAQQKVLKGYTKDFENYDKETQKYIMEIVSAFDVIDTSGKKGQDRAMAINNVLGDIGSGKYGEALKAEFDFLDIYGSKSEIALKKSNNELKKQEKEVKKTTSTIKKSISVLESLAKETESVTIKTKEERETFESLTKDGIFPGIDALDEFNDKQEETEEQAKKTGLSLDDMADIGFSALNMFEDLGIIGGKTADTLGDFASAGFDVAKAFTSGDPVDKITAVANAVGTLGKAIIEWLTGDGVGEAIERENEWMNITEDQEEALRDLEEQIGSTHAATSQYLDTLIDGAVTLQNSDTWLNRIRQTLSDVDQGFMTGAEAADEMGESFAKWLEQAKDLGTTGSQAFFDFVSDLENRGIEVKEITDFMSESFNSAVDNIRGFKDATGSTIAFPGIDEAIAKQDELAKDKYQPALSGLEYLTQGLIDLSNSAELTEQQFDSFENGAKQTFDTLISSGLDSGTALEQMQPLLSRLIYLQKEHGLTIDENTQKIIDDAKAAGIDLGVKKTIAEQQLELQQKQLELFEKIAEALGVTTSEMEKFGIATKDAFSNVGNGIDIKMPGINKDIPSFASGGSFTVPQGYNNDTFPMLVSSGERVNVTPAGETNNGNNTNMEVNIQAARGGDSEMELATKFISAYRKNTNNLKGEING